MVKFQSECTQFCLSMMRLTESWTNKILCMRIEILPSLPQSGVWLFFSHVETIQRSDSIQLKRTTAFKTVVTSLPEWAYLTLQGRITFSLTSKFADKSVSSERKEIPRYFRNMILCAGITASIAFLWSVWKGVDRFSVSITLFQFINNVIVE